MRLTTARYYTPSGRSIQAKGIEPDIIVEPAKIERLAVSEISTRPICRARSRTPIRTPARRPWQGAGGIGRSRRQPCAQRAARHDPGKPARLDRHRRERDGDARGLSARARRRHAARVGAVRPSRRGAMNAAVPRQYRRGVGIMLLDGKNRVFVGRRIDTPDAWQMPQGGIEEGEDPRAAALARARRGDRHRPRPRSSPRPQDGCAMTCRPPLAGQALGRRLSAARSRNGSPCASWAGRATSTSPPRIPNSTPGNGSRRRSCRRSSCRSSARSIARCSKSSRILIAC